MTTGNELHVRIAIKASLYALLWFHNAFASATVAVCKRPPDLLFVIPRDRDRVFTVDSTAKFKCLWNEEQMLGPALLRCSPDGKWLPDIKKRCEYKKRDAVSPVYPNTCIRPLHMYSLSDDTIVEYPVNTTVLFECYQGYRGNGPQKLTCGIGGLWLPLDYQRCKNDRRYDNSRIKDRNDPYEDSQDPHARFFARFDPVKILIATILSTIFMVLIAFLRAQFCNKSKHRLSSLTELNNTTSTTINDDSQVNTNLLSLLPNPRRFDDTQAVENRMHLMQPIHQLYVSELPSTRYSNDGLPSYEEVTREDKPPSFDMVYPPKT